MSRILLYVMALSTAGCAFNLAFYARFFWKAPGYGNALLMLYPAIFLVSSYLETNRIEASLTGGGFITPPWVRLALGIALLAVILLQAGLAIVYYPHVIRDIESRRVEGSE